MANALILTIIPVFFLILLLCSTTTYCSRNHIISTLLLPSPTSIFILAGQSNMVGQGGILNNNTWDGFIPPQCEPNPDQILRLNMDLSWEVAHEPLHQGLGDTCGIGPGMPFAHSLLLLGDHDDDQVEVIGLVPCASAGTNISQWARGTFLYNRMITRARAAVQHSTNAQIRALLWYQGESDTDTKDNAMLYKRRLRELFSDVRSDLMSPRLPVIQVALASQSGPFTDAIRKAQLEFSDDDLPNVECVDAWGLDVMPPDNLHLTTEAQVQLGIMIAHTFIQSNNWANVSNPAINMMAQSA